MRLNVWFGGNPKASLHSCSVYVICNSCGICGHHFDSRMCSASWILFSFLVHMLQSSFYLSIILWSSSQNDSVTEDFLKSLRIFPCVCAIVIPFNKEETLLMYFRIIIPYALFKIIIPFQTLGKKSLWVVRYVYTQIVRYTVLWNIISEFQNTYPNCEI